MINWKRIESEEQLEELINSSHDTPAAVFKSSHRCGASAFARQRLESQWQNGHGEIDFYFLDIIPNREISNEIAARFRVSHQSPQVILIRDGQSVYDASHYRVSAANLKKALEASRTERA
jgi:bacillithiol system protein YtxJ